MATVSKLMKPREFEFYSKAAVAGLAIPMLEFQVEGERVRVKMVTGTPLIEVPRPQRQQYREELLALVGKLHQLGILHCDLHEENILLYEERLYLIDFGMSWYLSEMTPEKFAALTGRRAAVQRITAAMICGR